MQRGAFYDNITPHLRFDRTIGEKLTSLDTILLIMSTVNVYANTPYIKQVVRILDQGEPDTMEFLKRLFYTACENVKYLRDPEGHEIVFTPKLLMQVGQGDCKKFTTYILSVLKCKGIPAAAKVVSYDGLGWAHIYVIVPMANGYVTLDPVNHEKFNQEVDYKKAQLFYLDGSKSAIMNKLSLMGSLGGLTTHKLAQGIGDAADSLLGNIDDTFGGPRGRRHGSCHNPKVLAGLGNDYMNGLGEEYMLEGQEDYISGIEEIEGLGKKSKAEKQQHHEQKKAERKTKKAVRKSPAAKAKRKATRKKIFKGAAKVGFAPTRAAFLALVALGGVLQRSPLKINLALKLAQAWQKDNGAKIVKVWEQFGGKREALAKAITKSSKIKVSGIGYPDNGFEVSGLGIVTATAAAATIAAATPITLAILKAMKSDKIVSEKDASNVEDASEVMEDVAMYHSKGDAKRLMAHAVSTELTQAGAELDDGGNQATQKDIVQAEASQPEPTEGDSENFKEVTAKQRGPAVTNDLPAQRTSRQASQDSQENSSSAADAPSDQQKDAPASAPQNNLPAVYTPQAKSIFGSVLLPYSWLKGLLLVILLCDIYKVPAVVASCAGIVCVVMLVATSIHSLIQKTKYNGKVRYQKNWW